MTYPTNPTSPRCQEPAFTPSPDEPGASKPKERSRPSASIPNAEQVPPQGGNIPSSSNISEIFARFVVGASLLFSGDFAGAMNNVQQVEKSTKKLAKQFERLKNSICGVAQAVVETAQTLPIIAEAAARVSSTFSQAFPFMRRFFS